MSKYDVSGSTSRTFRAERGASLALPAYVEIQFED
jgi:hypothetical protein